MEFLLILICLIGLFAFIVVPLVDRWDEEHDLEIKRQKDKKKSRDRHSRFRGYMAQKHQNSREKST